MLVIPTDLSGDPISVNNCSSQYGDFDAPCSAQPNDVTRARGNAKNSRGKFQNTKNLPEVH